MSFSLSFSSACKQFAESRRFFCQLLPCLLVEPRTRCVRDAAAERREARVARRLLAEGGDARGAFLPRVAACRDDQRVAACPGSPLRTLGKRPVERPLHEIVRERDAFEADGPAQDPEELR